jgi:DNA-binding winged helix-turn-helix (wHTH) protein
VIELLILLIENRERMISKQEINEIVWRGRIVSEAANHKRFIPIFRFSPDLNRTSYR